MANNRLWEQLREHLWEWEPANPAQRRLLAVQRCVVVLGRDLMQGDLTMRATSLVFTTLLSVVPLLALGFSLFKAFGFGDRLEPALLELLAPLGPQGAEITQNIVRFVSNVKASTLGAAGVALLFYTVLSMLQKIEASFNFVWRIERGRSIGQRLGEYLTVVIVGPLLVFVAISMTASILSDGVVTKLATIEPFGALIYMAGKFVPYVLIIAAFTFLYAFIPNTTVKIRAALAGGTLAGILWQTGSAAFAAFVAGATSYNAIYSSFAIMLLLLLWLYLGWLILLIGCQLSYYVQFPERMTATRRAPHLSGRLTELLGLQIFGIVGRRFLNGQPPPSLEELRKALPATPEHVDRVVEILLHRDLLAESSEQSRLLPKRDLGTLTVAELVGKLREGFDTEGRFRTRDELAREAAALIAEVEQAFERSRGGQSVREWLAPAKK